MGQGTDEPETVGENTSAVPSDCDLIHEPDSSEDANGRRADPRDSDTASGSAAAESTAPGEIVDASPFTRSFPDDSALKQLVVAFEQGRYDVTRKLAQDIIERSPDRRVRQSAKEVLRRLQPDPLAAKVFVLVGLLLVVLSVWAYTNHGAH